MKTIDSLIDIYKRLQSCSSIEEMETLKGNLKDSNGDKDSFTRKKKIEEVIGTSEEFEISGKNRKLGKNRISLLVELTKQVDDLIGEAKELAAQGEFPHGVTVEVPEPMTVELPTNGLVGQKFVGYLAEIWHFLQVPERAIIGVWGMGGVGKTSLLKHAHNLMLARPDVFGSVYWVTVSKDRNIEQLQAAIAKRIGKDLLGELDKHVRAGKLSRALQQVEKFVLFLDDMWEDFELTDVGIPKKSGCNLVLSSRSNHVCQKMYCQKIIEVEPLSEEDSWTLFLDRIGHGIPDCITETATNVVEECAGLPLGIITLARSMRGCNDMHEWKDILKKLRNPIDRVEAMEEKVFNVLRLSFERLKSSKERSCLLYCAAYPEDYIIPRNDLIWGLIDEGLLDENDSLTEMLDEGHTILNKLEGAALLSRQEGDVRMHDLIRDMALRLAGSEFMVKANLGLEAFPDVNKWRDKVVLVSLMFNQIKEMPSSSSKCRRLWTLLLQNTHLEWVRHGFLKNLWGLKVLNLSCSKIKTLPDSITSLKKLTSLILRECVHLESLPSLAKLTSLERLDLFQTRIAQVPSGLHRLRNLRYLNLRHTNIATIRDGVVRQLTALRYLGITSDMNVQELMLLNMLEHLVVHFHDVGKFSAFIEQMETGRSLSAYVLTLGHQDIDPSDENQYFAKKYVCLGNRGICRGEFPKLPVDTQLLIIRGSNGYMSSLCELLSSPLHKLEHLNLESVLTLQSLFGTWRGAELSFYSASCSKLKSLSIHDCHSLQTLFPEEVLTNLRNVEVISVMNCFSLEEMVGESGQILAEFSLPSLKNLTLFGLPNLKSLCRCNQVIHFTCLQAITIQGCPMLKRMPIDLDSRHRPIPRFRFDVGEETWVQYLEWDPPQSKSLMRFEKLLSRRVSWNS